MSRIIVPSRRIWTRQPQRPAGIDWTNPLNLGLVSVQDAKTGRDVIRGGGTLYNTASITSSVSAKGVDTNYNQNQIDFPVGPDLSSNTEGTILFLGALKSGTWNVATINHGMSVRQYDSKLCFGHGSNVAGYGVTAWTGISAFCGAWRGSAAASSAFLDGKKLTNSYTSPADTAAFATSTLGGARVGDRSSATYWASACLLSIRWSRALTDSELALVSANPWQIFKPRTRRTIIDLGGSGLSSVYADSALTYYIRSLLSSDSGIQYAIRNAIYKDDAVGYYLRSAISQNSEVGYVLRSAIAKDDAEAYKIRGLVQASDAEAYSIRGLVQTSDGEAYKIRSQVQADASTSYDIQSSTSVASSNAVNYSVRGAVAASVLVGYSVRGSAQRDAASAYSVRSAVSRDVAANYTVSASVASVYADSTASYSVDGVVPSGPSAESIAAAVVSALQGTTIPVNVTKVHNVVLTGSGTPADPMRPA